MQTLRLNKFGIILVIVLLVSVGTSVFFYIKLKNISAQQLEQADAVGKGNVVEQVAKLVILPENEEPTVATVLDLEKVKDQPFFAKAKVGDVVLIYINARKAFLYDPKLKKLIEVASLGSKNYASTTSSVSSTTTKNN